ncbi:MAG: RloB family protein [Treponema sp.]|jgi:hypothetical protein|nr:RloB family protein [Treponema sp.]
MSREKAGRRLKPMYLILVEGNTERIYFEELWNCNPRPGFTIKLKKAKHGNPGPLVQEAMRERAEGVYNFIWCVYDCDVFQYSDMKSFEIIYKKAVKEGIQFAESMPSIEAWFVLHYQKPQKFYQGKDGVIKDLQKYIPDYCKEQRWQEKNLYSSLKSRQHDAFLNVKSFELISHKNQDSSTSIHKLVKIFISGSPEDETP